MKKFKSLFAILFGCLFIQGASMAAQNKSNASCPCEAYYTQTITDFKSFGGEFNQGCEYVAKGKHHVSLAVENPKGEKAKNFKSIIAILSTDENTMTCSSGFFTSDLNDKEDIFQTGALGNLNRSEVDACKAYLLKACN